MFEWEFVLNLFGFLNENFKLIPYWDLLDL